MTEHLGRPELRILDVRWRPDGTGRQVYASGHVPGAAHLDWATELIDRDDPGQAFLLAGPEQVAGAVPAPGEGHAGDEENDKRGADVFEQAVGLDDIVEVQRRGDLLGFLDGHVDQ